MSGIALSKKTWYTLSCIPKHPNALYRDMSKKTRVVVAMSGGVDSSVTAALLSRDPSFEVVGITIKLWPKDASPGQKSCCGVSAVDDARRVASKLDIPYYALDMVQEFENGVITPFINSYVAGETPNPCLDCQKNIKFGSLLTKARSLNAKFVATGHYARLTQNDGRFQIYKAKDLAKDQSYTFYGLSQKQLSQTLLPLGNLTKPEVRKIAADLGLAVAEKKESMDICFTDNYRDFLAGRGIANRPGEFVTTDGKVVGLHSGHHNYTVGQRKGLNLALGEAYYVTEVQPDTNRVVVGLRDSLNKTRFAVNGVNWSGIPKPDSSIDVLIKIRYGAKELPVTLTPDGDSVIVESQSPLWGISPGQSAVFYNDSGMVLGGGYIAR